MLVYLELEDEKQIEKHLKNPFVEGIILKKKGKVVLSNNNEIYYEKFDKENLKNINKLKQNNEKVIVYGIKNKEEILNLANFKDNIIEVEDLSLVKTIETDYILRIKSLTKIEELLKEEKISLTLELYEEMNLQ